MKKFNRDYTTPEQSKRLLELGLQPNSANLYYTRFGSETFVTPPKLCYAKSYFYIVPDGYEDFYLPCWSVGRLMEIWKICYGSTCYCVTDRALIDEIVENFELFDFDMDFSKLEGW